MKIVKWLASERYCPVRVVRKRGKQKEGPLLTSRGRSPLGMALADQKLDIVRYLIAEKNMSFFEEKDLPMDAALASFASMLKMVPADFFVGRRMEPSPLPNSNLALHSSFAFSSNSTDSSFSSSSGVERRPSI